MPPLLERKEGVLQTGDGNQPQEMPYGRTCAVYASILKGQRPVLAQGGYRQFDFRIIPISPLFIHAKLNQGTQHNRSHKPPCVRSTHVMTPKVSFDNTGFLVSRLCLI